VNILFVNTSERLSSDGSRLISALLKRAGHSVKSVFMTGFKPIPQEIEEFEQLNELLKDSELVMIAVYSTYAHRSTRITKFIRERYPGLKVIWGGPHCISVPELSLPYADGVCYAEGDESVVELVNRMAKGVDYTDIPSMAFNVNGTYIKNPVLPPFRDLDSLPYPDYDFDNQYLLDRKLYQMTKEMSEKYFPVYFVRVPIYFTVTSRGCPYQCSYCNNIRYVSMWGRNLLRFRSVDNIIGELKYILERFDFFKFIGFGDDDFLTRPTQQLQDFAEKYKKEIGLPFFMCVTANTFNKKKIEIMLDAGLKIIQMGVQSGSQRVLDEVFNRKIKVAKTKEVIRQIESYQKIHDLTLLLDFIIDNPYETRDDIIQTYQYLVDLSPKVNFNLFLLTFFPGTPLYQRALSDKIIEPSTVDEDTFRDFCCRKGYEIRYQKNYELFLIFLIRSFRLRGLRKYIPKHVLRALGSRPVCFIASLFPAAFYRTLFEVIRKVTSP
jgi:anaerobic magnesium-protoporphyrin IX monomethyl ester cyclase